MRQIYFSGGSLILPDRIVAEGALLVERGKIVAAGRAAQITCPAGAERVEAGGGFIGPGYVDLHVHGGAGADFMDGTVEAWQTVLRAHARHGTTSCTPTTTVAPFAQILAALDLAVAGVAERGFALWNGVPGVRILGAHFYGPYFAPGAQGCHPSAALRPPVPEEYAAFLQRSEAIASATVAPELLGAEAFSRAIVERGICLNLGHTNATFVEVEKALVWGVRHVDHLFCAMSDKSKLRSLPGVPIYPMRGGTLEAALYFDELTTEVIADGKHLTADLLRLALKFKGPERLALVTDCNRALDLPDGEYMFGPLEGGTPFVRRDGVGIMPDGSALASGCMGMDHMVRTCYAQTGAALPEIVRMASATPAKILRRKDIGSLAKGKCADVLLLDGDLEVMRVFVEGRELL